MLTQVNYEVKGQLAKLLATEDLIIENRKVSTASFDTERRVLTLPMWEKASGVVYDLLVGHEVGHALYTPADNWTYDYPDVPMSYVNVLEDVRIEKFMKQRYPGLSKTFYSGYSQLAEQDFFELSEHDIEEMGLADRINIHYKIGSFEDVSFNDEEQYFVDKAFKTETFKDVLKLAQELYTYIKEKREQEEQLTKLDDLEFSMGESSSGSGMGMPFQPSNEKTDSEMDGDVDDGELSDKGGDGLPDVSDMTHEEVLEELERLSDDPIGGVHGGVTEAITDKTFQDNLENLNKKETSSFYVPEYVELPTLNLDTLVAKNSEVHSYLDEFWLRSQKNFDENSTSKMDIFEKVDNDYRLFRRSAQKEVNYLVKEFECRKSADAYARATVSKTGVLDCTKLHTYKFNEDLFKKITVLPDGKNHGLMFVLDWSGSMSTVLMDTIKQLFNLIWFCKKVQIPFQVFAFTNEWSHHNEWDDDGFHWRSMKDMPAHHEEADHRIKVEAQFSMVEFLTSDCKKSDLEKQMLNIWRLTIPLTQHFRWDSNLMYQYPRRLSLSGTPLNEALVSLNQLIPQFKKSTGVQKVQCVTLTDGEAHPLSYTCQFTFKDNPERDYMGHRSVMNGSVFIRDKFNGKTYYCNAHAHELTSALLNQLRGRFPDVNFIGIRVMDGRDANSFIRRYMDWDFEKVQQIQAGWKKDKSLKLVDVGYHAYFGLSSHALGNDTEFTVKEDATKAQIKSAFKKSLTAKKMNKKVLSQFMDFIA